MDVSSIVTTPPAPPRPTVPVPAPVSAFATRLREVMATTATAPVAPQPPVVAAAILDVSARHAATAVSLGTMLRAGGVVEAPVLDGGIPAVPAVAAPSVAGAGTPNGDDALAPVAAGATVTAGAGPLAGRLVATPLDGRVTSTFGPRVHPVHGGVRDHHGLDIAAPAGTRVRSVTDGTVIAAGDRGGYGLVVEVDHGGGITSRYAHLSAIDVRVGDRVDAGGAVGAVGTTGTSTGPHLHLEVRVHDEPVDPNSVGL